MVDVIIATEVTDQLVAAFDHLIPQLSSSNPPPGCDGLQAIVDSEASDLFVASDETGILGTLTLATFLIPTGGRAWIEDVVVSDNARGKGIGQLLSEHALGIAKELGVKTIDLTSRPSREAANALYKKIGFKQRETNVYRFTE